MEDDPWMQDPGMRMFVNKLIPPRFDAGSETGMGTGMGMETGTGMGMETRVSDDYKRAL
jgi:hypothetical protein